MNTPVSFPLAKLLKEKEFDINVGTAFKYTFKEGHIEDEYMNVASWNDVSGVILCPTISDVVMWLYGKYNIWISVDPEIDTNTWFHTIAIGKSITAFGNYSGPIEAYEKGIEHILNEMI